MESSLASLVVIAGVAALAPILVDAIPLISVPVVVAEIGLGILIGPQVLGLAHMDNLVQFLSDFGLAFLFFLAGFEIDFARLRGRPGTLAGGGWLISVVLAFAIAAVLQQLGFVISIEFVGLALMTTSLGTLMPILRDAGVLETRFGSFALGAGAIGEFGPIVLVALLLTNNDKAVSSALLAGFALAAFVAGLAALRLRPPRLVRLLGDTMHKSAQLPVRLSILMLATLVYLATRFSLDLLIGAFAAGIVVSLASRGKAAETLHDKFDAIGFGLLVPVFFVTTGIVFDLHALLASVQAIARVPVFLALFLVVRGLPALLYRKDMPRSNLPPLALCSATGLPLIVAISTIGLATGNMRTDTAAALVGAGMISVLLYPLIGLILLRRAEAGELPAEAAAVAAQTGAAQQSWR